MKNLKAESGSSLSSIRTLETLTGARAEENMDTSRGSSQEPSMARAAKIRWSPKSEWEQRRQIGIKQELKTVAGRRNAGKSILVARSQI